MLLDYQHSVFSTGVTDHWNEVDWTGLDSNTSDISYKLSETKFKHTQKSTQWNINFQGAVNFESYLLHIANSSLATLAMRGLNHLVSKPRPAFCHLQYLCTESLRRRLLLSVFYNFSFQVLCTRLIICILCIVNCVYRLQTTLLTGAFIEWRSWNVVKFLTWRSNTLPRMSFCKVGTEFVSWLLLNS